MTYLQLQDGGNKKTIFWLNDHLKMINRVWTKSTLSMIVCDSSTSWAIYFILKFMMTIFIVANKASKNLATVLYCTGSPLFSGCNRIMLSSNPYRLISSCLRCWASSVVLSYMILYLSSIWNHNLASWQDILQQYYHHQ